MWSATLALIALGLTGCDPDYRYGGYQIFDHFPLDGSRSWEYASDDLSVPYKLDVRMSEEALTTDKYVIREFQHFNQETGDPLLSVQWSSDSSSGVLIHGYQVFETSGGTGAGTGAGPGGGTAPPLPATVVSYAGNPVVFGDPEMAPGESVVTEVDGYTVTSTFEAVEPCENYWVADDWQNCLRIHVDDGDGDPDAGLAFAGTYWIVPRYGIAWMQLTGDSEVWRLVTASWAPDE